jgi:hypothetical protein
MFVRLYDKGLRMIYGKSYRDTATDETTPMLEVPVGNNYTKNSSTKAYFRHLTHLSCSRILSSIQYIIVDSRNLCTGDIPLRICILFYI